MVSVCRMNEVPLSVAAHTHMSQLISDERLAELIERCPGVDPNRVCDLMSSMNPFSTNLTQQVQFLQGKPFLLPMKPKRAKTAVVVSGDNNSCSFDNWLDRVNAIGFQKDKQLLYFDDEIEGKQFAQIHIVAGTPSMPFIRRLDCTTEELQEWSAYWRPLQASNLELDWDLLKLNSLRHKIQGHPPETISKWFFDREFSEAIETCPLYTIWGCAEPSQRMLIGYDRVDNSLTFADLYFHTVICIPYQRAKKWFINAALHRFLGPIRLKFIGQFPKQAFEQNSFVNNALQMSDPYVCSLQERRELFILRNIRYICELEVEAIQEVEISPYVRRRCIAQFRCESIGVGDRLAPRRFCSSCHFTHGVFTIDGLIARDASITADWDAKDSVYRVEITANCSVFQDSTLWPFLTCALFGSKYLNSISENNSRWMIRSYAQARLFTPLALRIDLDEYIAQAANVSQLLMHVGENSPIYNCVQLSSLPVDLKQFTQVACGVEESGFELREYQCRTIQFMLWQEEQSLSIYDRVFAVEGACHKLNDQYNLDLSEFKPTPPWSEVNSSREMAARKRTGGVLALQMRLGKTIIVRSFLQYIKRNHSDYTGPTLVLGSVSYIGQGWIPEFRKATNLVFCNLSDPKTRKFVLESSREKVWAYFRSVDVVFCQWSMLPRFTNHARLEANIMAFPWQRLVIDEFDTIAGAKSAIFKAFLCLEMRHVWLLSATPFGETAGVGKSGALFNACWGDFLPLKKWDALSEMPLQNLTLSLSMLVVMRFVQTAFVVLNSNQTDIQQVTSARNQTAHLHWIQPCEFPAFQSAYEKLRQVTRSMDSKTLGFENVHLANRLRQCCSSYLNVEEAVQQFFERASNRSSVAMPLPEVIYSGDRSQPNEFASKEDMCAICLDSLISPFELPCHHVLCGTCVIELIQRAQQHLTRGAICPQRCGTTSENGVTTPRVFKQCDLRRVIWRSDREGKLQVDVVPELNSKNGQVLTASNHPKMVYLKQLLGTIFASPDEDPNNNETKSQGRRKKVLIFSDMKSTQLVVESELNACQEYANRVARLKASTMQARCKIFDLFTDVQSRCDILILPIRIGAQGIDLSVADTIIFMEPSVNQSRDLQAVERIYKITKNADLQVHYLLMKDTIEEVMVIQHPNPLQEAALNLANAVSRTSIQKRKITQTDALGKRMKANLYYELLTLECLRE